MYISNSRKFIYLHVPKCGGESMTRMLAKSSTVLDIELGSTEFGVGLVREFRKKWGIWKHSSMREVESLLSSNWKDYRKFALARNPYDRAVSLYKYFCMNKQHGPHARFNLNSFRDFVFCPAFREGFYISAPQTSYLNGNLEELRIFKLERLNEDWDNISDWLAIPKGNQLVHANKSTGFNSTFFDDDILNQIYELWREDFELLEYARDYSK